MGLDHHYQVASMDAELVREAHSCLKCQKRDKTQAKTQAIGTGDEGFPGAAEDEECFGLNEEDGDEEEEEDGDEEEEEEEEEENKCQLAAFKNCFPHLKAAGLRVRGVAGRKLKPCKVVKGIEMIELQPQRFEVIPRHGCLDFDSYFDGPTLEQQRRFNTDGEGWTAQVIHGKHKPAFRSSGELFVDWGFRLMPEFAQMFATTRPQKFKEHCFPKVSYLPDTTHRSEEKPDLLVIGMEMMNEMVRQHPDLLVDIFAKGRVLTKGGYKFLKLDADQDNCLHSLWYKVSIKRSMDIDSIIVIMHKLVITADIEVSVLPTGANRPPLSKSNHTWIRLLQPQSEMDKANGGRAEWFETTHSLSQIPHMHFGTVEKTFDILIMFPRMKHRHPLTGRAATLIPWAIQNQFLVDVLHPAMAFASDEAMDPYVHYDIDTWRWKSANLYGFKKTVAIQHHRLSRLQRAMEEIIREDPDLVHFGSFFFLMDGKGIKLRTMTMTSNVNVLEVLQAKFSCVDFEELSKRDNGQVLMDIGLGYHPVTMTSGGQQEVKTVCLWDVEKLDGIYSQAGFNKGQTHHANTMAWFGGRQAEMRADRAPLVQLCFRSSYGLYYEPFRRVRGGEIPFCDDWDAYYTNQTFFDSLGHYQRIMEEAKSKSLGVRDELRGSLAAVKELLEDLPDLVRIFGNIQ